MIRSTGPRYGYRACTILSMIFSLSVPAAHADGATAPKRLANDHITPGPILPPVPVAVVNLPTDENGNVMVVDRSGEPRLVEVTNFPSTPVQQVTGTVDIGNLSLDEAGCLRTVMAVRNVVLDLVDSDITLSAPGAYEWFSDEFDTSQFSQIFVKISSSNNSLPDDYLQCVILSRWTADETFLHEVGNRDGPCGGANVCYKSLVGLQGRVRCHTGGTATLHDLKVLLTTR